MRIILIVFILSIIGCNNHDESLNQLKQLQSFFGTANWQVAKGTDTSYIFFSPQVDNSFKTYQYNLFRGDSANAEIGGIITNGERIEWRFFNRTLVLNGIKDNEAKWKDSTNANYVLTRQSDSLLLMKTSNDELQFAKTLPLSTFLVRAKYDFEHGSKLIDSGEIKSRKLIHY